MPMTRMRGDPDLGRASNARRSQRRTDGSLPMSPRVFRPEVGDPQASFAAASGAALPDMG